MRTLVAMGLATVCDAIGAILLAHGMQQVGPPAALTAGALLHLAGRALLNPAVWVGMVLLALFYVLYLVSLSWAELSFVLPLTATTYVLVTLLAFLILGERVSAVRWVGTLLVSLGIVVVVRS